MIVTIVYIYIYIHTTKINLKNIYQANFYKNCLKKSLNETDIFSFKIFKVKTAHCVSKISPEV